MTITITDLPTERMRNDRDPVSGASAARCKSQWKLVLTIDGRAIISCRNYYGGDTIPMDEWNGLTYTWGLGEPGDLHVIDRDRLAAALADGGELHTLLTRVHAGHSTVWDGNNTVGRLTDDAAAASDEICDMLKSDHFFDDSAPVMWDVGDYLAPVDVEPMLSDLGLTTESTEDQIRAAADTLRAMAANDDIELGGNITGAIRWLIEQVKDKMTADAEDET